MNGVNPNRPAAGARDDDPVGDPRAARRLYLASGIEGVSARKIAREAGCSPTAIYLYFRSVPDLLEHLRMEGHAILTARLRDVLAASAPDRLREMGRAYFRFGLENSASGTGAGTGRDGIGVASTAILAFPALFGHERGRPWAHRLAFRVRRALRRPTP